MTVKTKKNQILSALDRDKPIFLDGLRPDEVEVVVDKAVLRRFPAKDMIYNEAEGANHLYLILEGSARGYVMTSTGEQIGLGRVQTGTIMGSAALLQTRLDYIVSMEAVTRSVVLEWDRVTLRSLVETYPRLLENAMRSAYDFVVLYRRLHLAAICDSAEQRLAQVLGYLANGVGHPVKEGRELHITNEELASEAHVTIFTVSRQMRDWQRDGLVKKSRGSVVVLQPDALLRIA